MERLKEESLDLYGATREEIDETPLQYADDSTLTVTDAVERATVQGVYDTACRAGDPSGYVALGDAADAIVRRLVALQETPDDVAERVDTEGDLWRRVVQHVGDDVLSVRERDEETVLQATTPRSTIATVGEDQSAGGAGHGLLMWDAYAPLTWAGLDNEYLRGQRRRRRRTRSTSVRNRAERSRARRSAHRRSRGPRRVGVLDRPDESRHDRAPRPAGRRRGRRTIVLTRPADAPNVADTLLAKPPFCRSDSSVAGETRFYTSPRDLRIGGEAMTRPGSRSNVWVREDETGEVALRDDDGTEHARFPDAGALFSNPEPTPRVGSEP